MVIVSAKGREYEMMRVDLSTKYASAHLLVVEATQAGRFPF